MSLFESIDTAIEEFRQGRPVVVVDDDNRENEGDLIFPAAAAYSRITSFHDPLHLGLYLCRYGCWYLRSPRAADHVGKERRLPTYCLYRVC